MIDSGRTSQGSIRKGSEHGEQTRPGRESRRRNRGTAIPNGVGVGVPIAHQKITGREEIRLGRKATKKSATLVALRMSINVSKLENLPLEAKSREKNASSVKDVERRTTKGGRKENGRVLIPGSRRTPDVCPKVTIIGGVNFLEADHVSRVVAEKTENVCTTLRGGHALNVQGQDLQGEHRMR
jgi:hypothetical protein